jgi:hypothetical protein
VDLATALGPLVSSQPAVTADVADSIIISDASDSGNLKKALISTLPGAGTVTSVLWDTGYPLPTTVFNASVVGSTGAAKIRLGMNVQSPGKFMAGPISGSPVAPGFRSIAPSDLPTGTNPISAMAIDFSLGMVFYKTLSVNANFTFANPSQGQTVRVQVIQATSGGPFTVAWTTTPVYWPGGVDPVMTTRAGGIDIYTFTFINGAYYGTFGQDFKP